MAKDRRVARRPGRCDLEPRNADMRGAHISCNASAARHARGIVSGEALPRTPGPRRADKERPMFSFRKTVTLALAAGGLVLVGLAPSWPQAATPAAPPAPPTPAQAAPGQPHDPVRPGVT